MIEHEQRVREQKDGLRQFRRGRRRRGRARLEMADRLVGEIPHRPPDEARQPVHARRAKSRQLRLDRDQRVAIAVRLSGARPQNAVRLRPHKTEPRHALAALDALQQERRPLVAPCDLEIRRDRRLQIRRDLAEHGDEVAALPGQARERLFCRNAAAHRSLFRGREKAPPYARGGAPAVPPLFSRSPGNTRMSGTRIGAPACRGLRRPPVTGRARRRLPPARAGVGPRLRGPFNRRAGAGFQHPRLSAAPPRGLLLPIAACAAIIGQAGSRCQLGNLTCAARLGIMRRSIRGRRA